MDDKLHDGGLDSGLQLDFDNLMIMGHSSGAHVVVEFLKQHCQLVRGQILFSPVDGVDPFGLIDNFAITPGQVPRVPEKMLPYFETEYYFVSM